MTAFLPNNSSAENNVFNGLVFIPDMSGFTQFVHSTDVITGQQITSELLSVIVNQNTLNMRVAEIEGDAVFFYRHGNAPSIRQLFIQFEKMIRSFEEKRQELEKKFSIELNLALKVIAHYGSMAEIRVNNFRKLYGEVVVEAHRLLKNSIEGSSYLLLTESLFKMPHDCFENELRSHGIGLHQVCELYGDWKNICFTYFDFAPRKKLKWTA